jgi:hypothetical protein
LKSGAEGTSRTAVEESLGGKDEARAGKEGERGCPVTVRGPVRAFSKSPTNEVRNFLQLGFFGLWRVCFPPCVVRPGRRVPVQGLSEGSRGFRDRLPAWRGPGTVIKLGHQSYEKSKRNQVYGTWSQ